MHDAWHEGSLPFHQQFAARDDEDHGEDSAERGGVEFLAADGGADEAADDGAAAPERKRWCGRERGGCRSSRGCRSKTRSTPRPPPTTGDQGFALKTASRRLLRLRHRAALRARRVAGCSAAQAGAVVVAVRAEVSLFAAMGEVLPPPRTHEDRQGQ